MNARLYALDVEARRQPLPTETSTGVRVKPAHAAAELERLLVSTGFA